MVENIIIEDTTSFLEIFIGSGTTKKTNPKTKAVLALNDVSIQIVLDLHIHLAYICEAGYVVIETLTLICDFIGRKRKDFGHTQ